MHIDITAYPNILEHNKEYTHQIVFTLSSLQTTSFCSTAEGVSRSFPNILHKIEAIQDVVLVDGYYTV